MKKKNLKSVWIFVILTSLAFLFTHMRCQRSKENAVRAVPEVEEEVATNLEEPPVNPPVIMGCTNPNASNYNAEAESMSNCEFLCPDGSTLFNSNPYATNRSVCVNNPKPNTPPRLVIPPTQRVNEGQQLVVQLEGFDPDDPTGRSLSYSKVSLPSGARLSGNKLIWTPSYTQGQLNRSNNPAKEYKAKVKVSDGEDQAFAEFSILVNNVNRAPTFKPIDNKQVNENSTLNFSISADDLDLPDDQLIFTCESSATCSKVSFSPSSTNATITYKPNYNDAGTFELKVKVRDYRGNSDTETIRITVGNSPRPPKLVFEKDTWEMYENELISFPISGTDPDNDQIKITMISNPISGNDSPRLSGDSNFNQPSLSSRTFSWQPGFNRALNRMQTTYEFKFRVEENTNYKQFEEKTIKIKVSDKNRAPVLSAIPNQKVDYNGRLSFSISATDPDGDPITYSAKDNHIDTRLLSDGEASFHQGRAQFSFSPTNKHHGKKYYLKFTASDTYGASDSDDMNIEVGRPPANLDEVISLSSTKTYSNAYDTIHLMAFVDGSGSMAPAQARIFDTLTNQGMQDLFKNVNLKVSLMSIVDDEHYRSTNTWGFRSRIAPAGYQYAYQMRKPFGIYTLNSNASEEQRKNFFQSLRSHMANHYQTRSSLTEETPICAGIMMANYDKGFIKNPQSSFSIENNEAAIVLKLVGEANRESGHTCIKSYQKKKTGEKLVEGTNVTPARYTYQYEYVRVKVGGKINGEDVSTVYPRIALNSAADWTSNFVYIPAKAGDEIPCANVPNNHNMKDKIEAAINYYGWTVKGDPKKHVPSFCQVQRIKTSGSFNVSNEGETACQDGVNGVTFRQYIISKYSYLNEINTHDYCSYSPSYSTPYSYMTPTYENIYDYFKGNSGQYYQLEAAMADHLYNRFQQDLNRISYIGIHRKDTRISCPSAEATSYAPVNSLEILQQKLTNVGISSKTIDICQSSYDQDIQGSIKQTINNVLNKTYTLNNPPNYVVNGVTVQYQDKNLDTKLSTTDYQVMDENDGQGNVIKKIKIIDFKLPQTSDKPESLFIEYIPL